MSVERGERTTVSYFYPRVAASAANKDIFIHTVISCPDGICFLNVSDFKVLLLRVKNSCVLGNIYSET